MKENKIPKVVLSSQWFFFAMTVLLVMLFAEIIIKTFIFINPDPVFGFRELILYESLSLSFSVAIVTLIKKERVMLYLLGFVTGCLLSAGICSRDPAFMSSHKARSVQFYFSYESRPLILKPLSELQEEWQKYLLYRKVYKRYHKKPFRYEWPYK